MNHREKQFLSVLDDHKGIIYKVANTYCQDLSERDDLIQEISLQVWLSLENFNEQYKWSTWIYRIAINTSISFYRKNKIRKQNTVSLPPVIQLEKPIEQDVEEENLILLKQFIRELREIDRALILLHLEGLSSREISEVIRTTQTNVTTKISRIKKKLKRRFEEHNKQQHEPS